MPQTRGSGVRTNRLGAAITTAVVAAVVAPAVGYAQEGTGSDTTLPAETGNSSADQLIGQLPEEIVIGGNGLGSEALRDTGSAPVADAALSLGQVVGSVAPLEALGSAGGSAVASVASSGSLPGSVYVNPTGSLGSGTIGLGSVTIPEYVLPVLSLQLAGGFFAAAGERQEAGELSPQELEFWHGVVEGSAAGGALLTDAADAAGTELPGSLSGSIAAVQVAAQQDPVEENARRRAEAEAAAAEDAESGATGDGADVSDAGAADGERGEMGEGDDDETGVSPVGENGPARDSQGGTGDEGATLDAAAAPGDDTVVAGEAMAGPAEHSVPSALAVTGVRTTTLVEVAAVTVLLGGLMLAFARRRA
ncbi:hypothetical protein [Dietzia sp. ANT_WB102]|uniref:hypothetical protein n=1 Tax=Dietzia sp. ANT_WB102 TaxID=2597345 RepID=UPI0011EC6855|nr:hypothetical protein [Dietzia sp. ANT_WB102]KAA0918138.1 hypothetical protein FQ137_01770 [Dietzia sp. ANT_WB102]